MTSTRMFRALSAATLTAALGLAALTGCGKPPATQAEKKEDPKPDPKKEDPKKEDPKKVETPPESKSTLGPVEPGAEAVAETFLKELGQGTAKAESLSIGFLKSVGKPVDPLPDDIKNGFTRGNATRWLNRVGEGYTFSPVFYRKQAGDAIYWRGQVNGRTLAPMEGGAYSLRLVKEGGAWKVDALVLTSLKIKSDLKSTATDDVFQEFTVTVFAEALADASAMPDDARAPALAHTMTTDLRKKWAPPGKQDQDQGYDYSPGNLRLAAINYGGGTKDFTVSKTGDFTFSVVLNKPAGAKTIVVKLVKGATPGEWLVSDVTETKG